MRRGKSRAIALVCLASAALGASARTEAYGESYEQMCAAWETMRRADVDSPEFAQAGARLLDLIEKLPTLRKVDAAAALVDRYAGENVNATVMELFGPDPFPISQIRSILFDSKRSFSQRVVVRTYFSLCRAEYQTSTLSESARLGLMHALTDRIKSLVGRRTTYGEQRFLTHLCQSLLSRYSGSTEGVPQVRWLMEMLVKYADSAASDDILAASIRGWVELLADRSGPISSSSGAITSLGHWDPLVRWKASRYLARRVEAKSDVVMQVRLALNDPRDEVRAAAVGVFAVASDVEPQQIVDKLVAILTRGRGVIVQEAASAALAVRADQAGSAVAPLLDAFDPAKQRIVPGPKRTNSILLALAPLAKSAEQHQRERMLYLAVGKLPRAPRGALAVLAALGPDAKVALPNVKAYRRNTDRFMSQYIDRHVLPAIDLASGPPELR